MGRLGSGLGYSPTIGEEIRNVPSRALERRILNLSDTFGLASIVMLNQKQLKNEIAYFIVILFDL